MKYILATIPLLGVWLIAPNAANADHCQLSSTTAGTNATSYRLPASDEAHGYSWGNTSIRRDKSGLVGKLFNHNLRSIEIRAVDSAVAFYAYTGDEFDGKVHVSYCPKGRTCSVTWSGQVYLDSFICQREFADKANQSPVAVLDNPALPLSSAVGAFGSEFSKQVEPNVEMFIDLSTAIRWTTGVTTRRVLGGTTSWSDRYRDDLIFYKKFIMQPAWLGTYIVDVSIFMRPMLVNDRFVFDWRGHNVSIPSGFLSEVVASNISSKINGHDLENQLNDRIRIEAGKKVCTTVPLLCGANPDDDVYYEQGSEKITDWKHRMQLSFVAQFFQATSRRFFGWKNTSSQAPTIVLNRER